MAKNSANQKPIKIIAATSMTLFSLLSVFMGSMAWFNYVRVQNTDSDGFSIYSGSSIDILSCYAVRYDGNYGAIAYDVLHGNQGIEMSEYDYIFRDRNVNTPLFLRMEVTGFDASNDLTITVNCDGAYRENAESPIYANLSNVVCAKFLTGIQSGNSVDVDDNEWTGTGVTTSSVVASYQGMHDYAATVTGTPYVESGSKMNAITLTLDSSVVFDEDFIVSRKNSKNEDVDAVVVFLTLDYFVDNVNHINLVEDYIKSHGESDEINFFESDITSIALSNDGGHE